MWKIDAWPRRQAGRWRLAGTGTDDGGRTAFSQQPQLPANSVVRGEPTANSPSLQPTAWFVGTPSPAARPPSPAVRASWPVIAERADMFTVTFYDRLFEIDPTAAERFTGVDMAAQRKKLAQALAVVVHAADNRCSLAHLLTRSVAKADASRLQLLAGGNR